MALLVENIKYCICNRCGETYTVNTVIKTSPPYGWYNHFLCQGCCYTDKNKNEHTPPGYDNLW